MGIVAYELDTLCHDIVTCRGVMGQVEFELLGKH